MPRKGENDACYAATAENAYSGDYPLAHLLYIYLNKNPNQPTDPLCGEFLKHVLSKDEQTAVLKDGYYPVSTDLAASELREIAVK